MGRAEQLATFGSTALEASVLDLALKQPFPIEATDLFRTMTGIITRLLGVACMPPFGIRVDLREVFACGRGQPQHA